ncbi:hypothetical protein A2631_01110 [Candidatus Daviesbacteria bacterium RIFCSPHIGHO2_01_FULL_44_29]|uniref:Uncharacterized protein n=1 Tax=Candidatus Daviesbacteria bacterium RIFCSPHIGHO2_02_FULL_43_12 TaxID=1797776 RepID=A0A1F5KIE6_9BACT|nr:MAG: hypothetical protein A2631_01110 [Candidatus Daviesbacteria bacterium RIFCSPHIGHO2_01_FULL_44_29]OGE40417.1 MAG: hypothetical protein A3E86_03175 [Candidatus Daviesbacteria bacterium RIFCSPHIGHO2_12_FULL_47_45]OGE40727.1 MAG: hypothetical protein A3D25_05635 [Candidatus Daviesbacteria bacterium RIFCSPHIGHO2_02_FULL_43_12]OGE69776.1 MAG: hypothetical protein A3B55_05175 [Candidatus Daviesbacteria bacterium RIFCSPLOWO2_01_FULL_43_15]
MKLNQTRLQLLIILTLTFLSFSNIFFNQPIIDDKVFINKDYLGSLNITKALQGAVPTGHEGVYRPVRSLLYLVYYQVWGTNTFFYHLHSILLHLVCTTLVFFIIKELVKRFSLKDSSWIPFLTALFFGLHPIHTESITYIAASMDMTGIALMLGAYLLYLHKGSKNAGVSWKYNVSYLLGLLAFFTYEMTLMLPILILWSEVCFKEITVKNWKKKLILIWPFLAGTVFYIVIRFFLVHATTRGPYLADSVYLTMLTMSKVIVKYLTLTIYPFPQANNHVISSGIEAFVYRGYRTEAIKAQSLLNLDILVALLILIAIVFLMVKFFKKWPLVTFGIGWFLLSLLPVLEIVPQGSMLNERSLYLASLGSIFLAGLLINLIFKSKYRSLGLAVCTIIVVSFSYLTFTRNMDWRNELIFWSHDIAIYPDDNAYAYFQRGNAYLGFNQPELGMKDYQQAFLINLHFAVAIASAAKLYQQQNQTEEALKSYQKSVQADPFFWEGWFNLGNIYFSENKLDQAGDVYFKSTKINPSFQPALGNLQMVIDKLNQDQVSFTSPKISFKYPQDWIIDKQDQNISLSNQTGSFKIIFNLSDKNLQPEGRVIKQGLAQIPNVDSAKVVVWSSNLLQFFLTKGKTTIEVIVSPADSVLMKVFDRTISSLKI